MKKIVFLSFLLMSLYANAQDESDRRVMYGLRVGAPISFNFNKTENNVYKLDFNALAKIRTIGDFFFIQPELGIPINKDSIPVLINVLVRIKTWELIGGFQYNYKENSFSSYGMNFGISKKIIEQITIGFNCYIPNKNLGFFKESHLEQNFQAANTQFNIQFRF